MHHHRPHRALLTAGVAVGIAAFMLSGCAPTAAHTAPASQSASPSPSSTHVEALPVVSAAFGPAQWSAQSVARSSPPLIFGDIVVTTDNNGITGLNAHGEEQWQSSVAPLQDSGHTGVRVVVAATPNVVAIIDQGPLPKGSDALAAAVFGTRVTLLNAEDGSQIATQTIPGDVVTRTTGMAFTITKGNVVEYVAVSPDGEKITEKDGKLPIATVGEAVAWGIPDTGNMNVQTTVAVGLPLDNASIGASDGRSVAIISKSGDSPLHNDDTKAWVNLKTGKILTPDASCTSVPAPQVLQPSADGNFVVGGNAIADVTKGTISCVGGGANQRTVTLDAVTNDGTAYGRADGDGDPLLVIAHEGDVQTYPIPAAAKQTRLVGFTSKGTAILTDPTTGLINGNPAKR